MTHCVTPDSVRTAASRARRWRGAVGAAVAVAVAACGWLVPASPVEAQGVAPEHQVGEPQGNKYLRFVRTDDGGGVLQASVVRFTNEQGVSVDLVSAVHVGDQGYYDELNDRFDDYDALLYEMVKPKNMEAFKRAQGEAPGGAMNWVGTLQRAMQEVLDLKFQLDEIDYSGRNFVHADLDLETFLEMQEQRGESFLDLILNQMLREMANPRAADPDAPPPVSMMEIMNALTSPDRSRELKLLLARELSRMGDLGAALEGPDGSVILTERNKKAVEVLDQRIKQGDKKLGLFYGAAHLDGIEEMLAERGFKQAGEPQWINAWDMRVIEEVQAREIEQLKKDMQEMKQEMERLKKENQQLKQDEKQAA